MKVGLHEFSVTGSWLGGFGVTVSSETATGPPDFPLTTGHGGSDLPGLTAHRNLSGFSLSRVTGCTSLMGLLGYVHTRVTGSPDFGHGHHPRRIGFPGFRVDSISGSLS
jgi:hypothetical protein